MWFDFIQNNSVVCITKPCNDSSLEFFSTSIIIFCWENIFCHSAIYFSKIFCLSNYVLRMGSKNFMTNISEKREEERQTGLSPLKRAFKSGGWPMTYKM